MTITIDITDITGKCFLCDEVSDLFLDDEGDLICMDCKFYLDIEEELMIEQEFTNKHD